MNGWGRRHVPPSTLPHGQTQIVHTAICLTTAGKEELDLGPNDLHLDDFLLHGKFDLIAYADPELNLEDKKDMFNEDLDLSDPAEETHNRALKDKSEEGADGDAAGASGKPGGQVKQEASELQVTNARQDKIKMETGRDCLSLHNPLAAMTPSRGQGSEPAAGLYQGTSQLAGQHGALNPQPGSSMAHIKVALPSLLAGRLLNKHSLSRQ